jgi:phage-related minor tail protein
MLVGSAFGKVVLDVAGVIAGTKSAEASMQSLQKAGQALGQSMQQVGQTLTIGLTLPIVAMGGAAIKLASDLEETRNKVKVIFGDMADDMLDWSETANQSLGMTREAALNGAADFAIFGKAARLSGQDLVKFSQANVQLATDFASFYNTSPEQAIIAIGAAYRGESEPIRSYGVLLNEAAIKQKAMQMGLLDANGELSQQNRILAVNKLILEQTTAAQGDFARTSDGLANQTRILNAQFQDTLAELGENILPMALQVVTALNDMLKSFNAMPEPLQNAVLAFAGFLAVLGPILSVVGSVLTTISGLATAWPAITAGATAVVPALGGIGAVITGTVIPALGAFIAAALPIIAPILLIIGTLFLLYAAFQTNFLGIRTTWEQLMFILGYAAETGWKIVVEQFKAGWQNISNWVAQVRETIMSLTQIDWSQIGYSIVAGIINGLLSAWQWLVDTVTGLAQAAYDAAKSALGIASPSKKFAYLGEMSGMGYMMGMANSVDPGEIAKSMIRPVTQISNQTSQQATTYNFASGLTMREARGMMNQTIDRRERQAMKRMR